jgi:hypothetical protein
LWCKESGVQSGDIFFSRYKNDKRKQMIPKMVNMCLKDAARNFGLPPAMFSTHCNRIGCATDLVSDGLQDGDLRKFVGWNSDSSLLYQHGSSKDPSALRSSSSGSGLSLNEVANLVPVSRSSEMSPSDFKNSTDRQIIVEKIPRSSRMKTIDSLQNLNQQCMSAQRAGKLFGGGASLGK